MEETPLKCPELQQFEWSWALPSHRVLAQMLAKLDLVSVLKARD
jgi:hypothetical protein